MNKPKKNRPSRLDKRLAPEALKLFFKEFLLPENKFSVETVSARDEGKKHLARYKPLIGRLVLKEYRGHNYWNQSYSNYKNIAGELQAIEKEDLQADHIIVTYKESARPEIIAYTRIIYSEQEPFPVENYYLNINWNELNVDFKKERQRFGEISRYVFNSGLIKELTDNFSQTHRKKILIALIQYLHFRIFEGLFNLAKEKNLSQFIGVTIKGFVSSLKNINLELKTEKQVKKNLSQYAKQGLWGGNGYFSRPKFIIAIPAHSKNNQNVLSNLKNKFEYPLL